VNALADSEADIAGFKVVVDGQEINTFQPNATRNGGSFTFTSNQTGRHNLSITVTDLERIFLVLPDLVEKLLTRNIAIH
jgi:hypothetical protein